MLNIFFRIYFDQCDCVYSLESPRLRTPGYLECRKFGASTKKVCLDKGGERDVGRQGGHGEFLKQIKIAHALRNASNFKGGHVQQFSSAKTEEMCDSRETFLSPFSKFRFFIGFCAVALSRFHFGSTLSARKRECQSL